MSWLQISINTTKNHAEVAEDCLFSAGAQTVTLTDAADQPILEPGPDETPVWNNVIITGLFALEENQQALLDIIEQCLTGVDFTCDTQILEDQNWTRAWMEHFHAMQFGQRLWVCPLHMEPPEPDAINLRLDPGLAFGTGTHPTTSLCLRWLDQNIVDSHNEQDTLLDYGCGSGILAIAACMLGIDHADGVDIDPQALTATHDNAETNQVRDKIETFLPDDYQKQHADTQYDIVVANILSGPLAELASMLAGHTKAGGDIVLSGILREQAGHLIETYSQFFKMDEPVFEEDWVLLHGVKK
ncbi:MAG: 50S ribosomal protein L11 methyltransferase [Gammaproteobacteria bacterium]|jgi:ribosomal protein L11 methyltransferase|nr:50S ribosomal protein L11 methyltransferase [Gammaproteobacteria bacterium]